LAHKGKVRAVNRLNKTIGNQQSIRPHGQIRQLANSTFELSRPRIHVPGETEQRSDADRAGNDKYGQHLKPRNKLLRRV
jgi:hypothetical protein